MDRLGRRMAVVLSAGTMAATLAVAAPAHAHGGPDSDDVTRLLAEDAWYPEVQDSRQLEGKPVVSGRVSTAGGVPVEAGAGVVLVAWPSAERLRRLTEGDAFHLKPLAKTWTGADGSFSLRLDPDVDLTGVASEEGIVNVTINVLAPQGMATWSFSMVDADKQPAEAGVVAVDMETRHPKASSALADLNLVLQPLSQFKAASDGSEVQDHLGPECLLQADLGAKWTTVGKAYLWTGTATYKYDYTSSATVTTGIASSASGAFGSYSQTGTHTFQSDTTIGWFFDWQTGRYLNTQYMISRYVCLYLLVHVYYVQPRYHYGGQQADIRGNHSGLYCADHGTGSANFVKTTTTATTTSSGIRLGSVIGIDLTSRSGYTTSSKVTISFKPRATVCGTSGAPASSPGIIVVRSYGWRP